MIFSGEKLVCTGGNYFFKKGSIYTVGDVINKKLFELRLGTNDEYWYATKDSEGICVRFDSKEYDINNAWFCRAK